ncbi:hypothetical protein DMB45_12465 [Sanguibacteroides justesenii]|uniref:Lipoprotein n=2 Tax=Sanguibacteroides justesenii TaxID=1547597 RepID=A0AB34R2N7_9PORP|nr:hypothetical protein IE90_13730 [Sanguibacteroides justesenii]PXZ43193.1 hypothetical protein DMB45_12465 [Sanguibacteroides justesenii]
MKIYLMLLIALCGVGCVDDKEIGNVELPKVDYILPQGESPADDRVVELYEKYNTYFLYKFTKRDLEWSQVENVIKMTYEYEEGDPQYVGNMLNFLNEVWFRFYSEEFHKKNMSYKVFLCSKLQTYDDFWEEYVDHDYVVGTNWMAINNCSEKILNMSASQKLTYKNSLAKALWIGWIQKEIIKIPDEFFVVSDYSKVANNDPASPDYGGTRGFVKGEYEWTWYSYPSALKPANDWNAYIYRMLTKTSAQWADDLQYPLVKKKYDLLRNYFIKNYGVDIQKIGDATF